ncbi:polysialyltransferase family glycosyltransferase [Pseudomonas panipatensis]|uniref:Uncharacterized protein n=1 Tax=Pseudomonas panipatensis TaxID=428992 RepID=A0A1G8DN25_9PSED|nr:polysialyltransferase family glycosyltransferase [Pseudomonas panipatensis]SDH58800.1 hypothetical protein SAMN05216272_10244 [Pseudomonas panipatensis]SMP40861.1 hypothetical protein SAMN06295951_101447 [Pseudomonas panipatensis]
MKETQEICLLYTNYHSLLWDSIANQIDCKNITTINFSKRKTKSAKCITIERSEKSKIAFLLICMKVAITAKFKKYNLFIPHPDHLLGNTLFFGRNAKRITIIEDGVLNYYDNKRNKEIDRISRKRRHITMFTPFQYKAYSGHLSGIDAHPPKRLYGWFTSPEDLFKRNVFKETYKIPTTNLSKETHQKYEAFFIDQPIENFLNQKTAKALREKAKKYMEENFNIVFFKSHPESKSKSIEIRNKVEEKESNLLTAEELIMKYNPDHIISYCSTSLLNSRRLLPNSKITSIGIDEITNENKELQKIKILFEKNNIETI